MRAPLTIPFSALVFPQDTTRSLLNSSPTLAMPPSSTSSREEFQAALLDLLWQQWTTLGVPGTTPNAAANLIDPEALLLVSTEVARLDARLFDGILDWLDDHADWINLQRLRRLQSESELGQATVLAAIGRRLARRSIHAKWKSIQTPRTARTEPLPLFPDLGHVAVPDPDFLAHGWLRGQVHPRRLATAPDVDHPANLMLKLRALFGRQSRAEVMAWLLTHPAGNSTEIARQCGYFQRSVQLTLGELERSRLVYSTRKNRAKTYSLDHAAWNFLVHGGTFPRWLHWPAVFGILQKSLRLMHEGKLASASPDLRAIAWRQAFDPADLAASGLPPALSAPIRHSKGDNPEAAYLDRLHDLLIEVGANVPR